MRCMSPEDAPSLPREAAPAPGSPSPFDDRMQAWLELRDQLRLLEAQLETLKLMMRLQRGR